MHLLPFDSDDTFGDASNYGPANFHDVVVEIGGYFLHPYYPGYDNTADGIMQYLNDRGWIVERVQNITQSWFPQASGSFAYRLYAVVGNLYSDQTVRDNLRRDLAELFVLTGLTVVSPAYSPSAAVPPRNAQAPGGGIGSTTGGGLFNVNLPPAAVGPGAGNFLDSFATGLGVSTPIAIGGAVVIAILLLRNR